MISTKNMTISMMENMIMVKGGGQNFMLRS